MARALLVVALTVGYLLSLPASAHADDPLICVETGAVWVDGVIYYDPPDPCIL